MFINELQQSVSTRMISRVLQENFDFDISKINLTEAKAKIILEDVCAKISVFRNTKQYFLGERNAVYLSMLATAKYLTEYLRERQVILVEASNSGLTAGKAIAKAREIKDQSADTLDHLLKKIAEAYLINVARIWAAKRPNNTLMIDFAMGGIGIHINGNALSNREINSSRWWTGVDDTLRKICGDLFQLTIPRTMEVRDGVIYFKGEETRRSIKKPVREATLTEAPKKIIKAKTPDSQAAMYHSGIKKGAGHAIDTTRKFVPHVVGSAIGAFTAGLKGQSLQSEHGRVKITNLEQELEMVNPKNPESINKFFGSQMKEHFGEFKDPNSRRAITDYMNKIYLDGLAGKLVTTKDIETSIPQIKGNPFKNVTEPKLRKELVNYFMNMYVGAKKSTSKQATNIKQLPQRKAASPAMNDVVSALQNLGYSKKNAIDAVTQAINKTPELNNNFEKLLRIAQTVIRK